VTLATIAHKAVPIPDHDATATAADQLILVQFFHDESYRATLSAKHVRYVGVRELERSCVRQMFCSQKQPANPLLKGVRYVAEVVQVCLKQEGGDVPVDFPPHRV